MTPDKRFIRVRFTITFRQWEKLWRTLRRKHFADDSGTKRIGRFCGLFVLRDTGDCGKLSCIHWLWGRYSSATVTTRRSTAIRCSPCLERLRKDGFKTILDQNVNGSPVQGWPRWMLD